MVLKATPPDELEAEVKTLAGRIANVPLELLMPHKSLINKVMDLMGHRVAQQMVLRYGAGHEPLQRQPELPRDGGE